ncbi:MAG: Tm-1-like ATP-binding domain-containing protein [Pseudomonadota bacterium]
MSARTIAVLATLDTKGDEADFLRAELAALGSEALVVDMGVVGEPGGTADISRAETQAPCCLPVGNRPGI